MGRDFFKIQKNIDSDKDGYQFTYYPGNNHEQNIGCSVAYDSYKEAKEALEQFRSFVKINNIKDMHSPYITIVKLMYLQIRSCTQIIFILNLNIILFF